MSVLIKGMEMPADCDDCFFCGEMGICSAILASSPRLGDVGDWRYRQGERPPFCPLVAVPDHGRLIDGDILQEQMKKRKNFVGRVSDADCLVADAPTIIPADEEDGDG